MRDVLSGRFWRDKVAANNTRGKNNSKNKELLGPNAGVNLNQHFSRVRYAASGQWLLASSRNSPHIVLYDTNSYLMAMRFQLTHNLSLSGVQVMLNSKNMTEAGVSYGELDVSDSEPDEDRDAARWSKRKKDWDALPGVFGGEAAKGTSAHKELHIWDIDFALDGRSFSAATSHGVYCYSAETGATVQSGTSGGMTTKLY